MIYVGIDIGLTGAICIMEEGKPVKLIDTPTYQTEFIKNGKKRTRTEYDLPKINAILKTLPFGGTTCLLEKVSSRPGEGSTSSFRFGKGTGILEMGCVCNNLPYELVHPSVWKRSLGLIAPKGQKVDKDAGRLKALALYPELSSFLKRKKDHNRGDAVLIAHYGKTFRKVNVSPIDDAELDDEQDNG